MIDIRPGVQNTINSATDFQHAQSLAYSYLVGYISGNSDPITVRRIIAEFEYAIEQRFPDQR